MKKLNPELFHHPLMGEMQTISVEGKPTDVVDGYAACGYWLYLACSENNPNAIALCRHLITIGSQGGVIPDGAIVRCRRGKREQKFIHNTIQIMKVGMDKKAHLAFQE